MSQDRINRGLDRASRAEQARQAAHDRMASNNVHQKSKADLNLHQVAAVVYPENNPSDVIAFFAQQQQQNQQQQ